MNSRGFCMDIVHTFMTCVVDWSIRVFDKIKRKKKRKLKCAPHGGRVGGIGERGNLWSQIRFPYQRVATADFPVINKKRKLKYYITSCTVSCPHKQGGHLFTEKEMRGHVFKFSALEKFKANFFGLLRMDSLQVPYVGYKSCGIHFCNQCVSWTGFSNRYSNGLC